MRKAALREAYLQRRRQLDDRELERRTALIKAHFFDFFQPDQLQAVHVFLPIKKHKEIDVTGIIEGLRTVNPGAKVIISRSNLGTFEMESFLYTPETPLQENKWGIAEPVDAEVFKDENLTMVLVPLLAFDREGHRVGYGKGFYDRFLGRCPSEVLKVGLSLEPPVEKILDSRPYDVKLDYCVTPEKVYRFP